MSTDLKSRLSKTKKLWKKAKSIKPEDGYERADDGKYLAQLTSASLKDNKNGDLMMVSEWTIVRGDFTGMTGACFHGCETAKSLPWLQEYLRKLDVDVDSIDITDLESVCEELTKEKPGGRITLKTKGEWQNCDLDQLVEIDADDDDDADDDTPAAPEIEQGSRVTMEYEGEDWEGEVVRLHKKNGQATVLFDKTKEEDLCDLADLELLHEEDEDDDEDDDDDADDDDDDNEDDDESRPPVMGDLVTITWGKKEKEGKVVKVKNRAKTCIVMVGKKEREFAFAGVKIVMDDED